MDVGVRELKERLSEYLERASRGEVIRVTDRGQPKAILAPLPGAERLRCGIEEGWIKEGDDDAPVPVKRAVSRRRISGALDDDRGR